MPCCFAILPDEPTTEGPVRPLAVFASLEDAMDWGSRHYRGGAFRIRYVDVVAVAGEDDHKTVS